MDYKEYYPSKQFQKIIQSYWCFNVNKESSLNFPIQHETIPDSSVSIVLIKQPYFQGIRLLGPHTLKFSQPVFADSTYFGIRLFPWILIKPKLFDKINILNKTAEAPYFIESHFNNLIGSHLTFPTVKSIENSLMLFLQELEVEENELVKFICLELEQGKSIASIVENVPFSVRVIQKKFKEVVGVTMKQYMSNIRQRKLWVDLLKKKNPKLDTILDHGYYDQPHFINEFKKKMQRSHTTFEINLSLL